MADDHDDDPGRPADRAVTELLRIYLRAEAELTAKIAAALKRTKPVSTAYDERVLADIRQIIRTLDRDATPLAAIAVRVSYAAGSGAVDIVQPDTATVAFGRSHDRATRILAESIVGTLDETHRTVGRRAQDAYRKAALEAIARQQAIGEGRRYATARMEDILRREGITGFVDKAGRRWTLHDYATMATITTAREATTLGTLNRMADHATDLFTVSKHTHPADECTPHESKTYARPGVEVRGYPTASPADLPPYHPRCRHVIAPAAANLDAFEAALEKAERAALRA